MPGSVEFLGNQSTTPPENGIRLGNPRDVLQGFTAESLGDLAQGGSLGVRQPQAGWKLGSEDAILGGEVFIAEQQLLINEARHKGKQARPVESIVHSKGPS
jgi:hypothetical protein